MFSKTVRTVFAATLWQASAVAQAQPASKPTVKYGSNSAVGKTFTHDGVKLYYEVYGTGEQVLLIHGNGGDIASMTAQIMYFRKHYQVIAIDSRDQGKSADSPDKINRFPALTKRGTAIGSLDALRLR